MRRYRYWPMDRVLELLKRAQKGDKEARNTLIEENVGLVWSIVRRFSGRGYEPEDLFQVGTIGLMKAVDYFDDAYDVRFSTYAVPMITGEIRRFLRDDGMIKVSRTIKDHAGLVRKCCVKLAERLGREPTPAELAKETGLSAEDVVAAMMSGAQVESLHKVVYQGDGSSIELMDRLEDTRDENEAVLNRFLVRDMLSGLNDEEKKIIIWRYFEQKTQSQIARKLGISQVQVSRLEKKILRGIRMKFPE